MDKKLIGEFEYCIKLWEEKGSCTFGGNTNCSQCGVPYLLYKLLTGNILHGDIKRLSLVDWKSKLEDINK
ncbi:MAG: hypothetical protein V3575_06990 [Candidatus Absconditabacteria bacterium]